MARHFDGGASTDKITLSSVSKFDDMRGTTPFTITMWFKPEDNGSNEGYALGKRNSSGDAAPRITVFTSGGQARVDLTLERDTESANARSLNVFTYDIWQFIAVAHTLDDTPGPTQFRGVPGGAVTQVSYNRQRAGTGDIINNVNDNLCIGNIDQNNRAFLGDIAEVRIYDVDIPKDFGISTAENIFTSIMYGRYHRGTAGSLIGYWPLNGGSPEPDLSGNGPENGTLVGTDIVDHAPTAPLFGFDYSASPIVSAAAPALVFQPFYPRPTRTDLRM